MKKMILVALAGALSGLMMAAPAVNAADAMPKVKPHHEKVITDCAVCHSKENAIGGNPFVVPKDETCIACHGDYKVLAKKTEGLDEPNPHASHHYGAGVSCTACHKEHEKSAVLCNDCHEFKYSIK